MLAELAESEATGEIAAIYEEIRRLGAVPYVSSMQRHLATRPGWLEWAWSVIAPAFRSGLAQETGWRLAAELPVAPLPSIPREALRVWQVDAAAERSIAAVCDSFIRVAPANLVFSGLLRRLLSGELPGGAGKADGDWLPPEALPRLPAMADPQDMDDDCRAVLMRFATDVAGTPFVPGFYRMLAQWPGLLAHLSVTLVPRFTDTATGEACAMLRERIDAAVPEVLATLPLPATVRPMPPADEHAPVLAALATYRRTSPEMVVFSRLVRGALPGEN